MVERIDRELTETIARLEDFPRHLSVPYKVPIGPLAFFEGQLRHTNEVMVLLGSEYFAEMTAPRAAELLRARQDDLRQRHGIAPAKALAPATQSSRPADSVTKESASPKPASQAAKNTAAAPTASKISGQPDAVKPTVKESAAPQAKPKSSATPAAASSASKPPATPAAASSSASSTPSASKAPAKTAAQPAPAKSGIITIMEEYDSAERLVGSSTFSSNDMREKLGEASPIPFETVPAEEMDESLFEEHVPQASDVESLIERLKHLEALEARGETLLRENEVDDPAAVFNLLNAASTSDTPLEEPSASVPAHVPSVTSTVSSTSPSTASPTSRAPKSVRFAEGTKAAAVSEVVEEIVPPIRGPLQPLARGLTAVRDVVVEQVDESFGAPHVTEPAPVKVSRFKAARQRQMEQ